MASDTLLIVGCKDRKLTTLLTKLGYHLVLPPANKPFPEILNSHIIDLVLIDARNEPDALDLCQFFNANEASKTSPLIVLCGAEDLTPRVAELGLHSTDLLLEGWSPGTVVSRIATLLRLRKFNGEDPLKASLAEVNSALRDVNERLTREREQARAIQQSLLPASLPVSARYELAITYKPLDEVGGDWYFFDTQDSGLLRLLIADVTGHGLSAAFIGSMTKLAISAVGREEPAVLLKGINKLLAPILPEGKFITMAAVLYDPASGNLTFARAGHPPGLVFSAAKKQVTELKGSGFAIGFFEDGEYEHEKSKLEVNDTLVLLTDGVPEAQNRSKETYGNDRIKESLQNAKPGSSAAQILELILSDFKRFSSERLLKDDYTVLVLRRTA